MPPSDSTKRGRGSCNLLGLANLLPTDIAWHEKGWQITAEAEGCTEFLANGPCAGCQAKDWRESLWPDLPHQGRPCKLRLRLRRRKCRQGLAGADRKMHRPRADLPAGLNRSWGMTDRLGEYVAELGLRLPLAEVAELTGVPRPLVSALHAEVLTWLDAHYQPVASRVLSLDQCHPGGHEMAVLSDFNGRRVIEILPRNTQVGVAALLRRLVNKDQVEAVVIDHAQPYRRAIASALPHAAIITDRRHVQELARTPLVDMRRSHDHILPRTLVRQTPNGRKRERLLALLSSRRGKMKGARRLQLDRVLASHPRLKAAYEAKEAFCDIYLSRSRADAEAAFARWQADLPVGIGDLFRTTVATVEQWYEQTFAYFDHPDRPTNGFAEAANRRIKEIHALGRGGMRFSSLRMRVLHRLGPVTVDDIRQAAQAVLALPRRRRTRDDERT